MHRTTNKMKKRIIPVEYHDFICRVSIFKDLVMKIDCTCTCAFTDEGMNGFISASGKGDLLRQVIVHQSNIDYLPIPRKLSVQMERTSICVGVHLSSSQSINQSINQSVSRGSNLLVSKVKTWNKVALRIRARGCITCTLDSN